MAPAKTVALLVTVDPRQGGDMPGALALTLEGEAVAYTKSLRVLGVQFDPQLRFTAQAGGAAGRLLVWTNILRALAGKSLGGSPVALRRVYEA